MKKRFKYYALLFLAAMSPLFCIYLSRWIKASSNENAAITFFCVALMAFFIYVALVEDEVDNHP